jgi:hypothetical protein
MKYDCFESKLCWYSITARIKLFLNKTMSKKSGGKCYVLGKSFVLIFTVTACND